MDDKTKHYIKRTFEHIQRVQQNMVDLLTNFAEDLGLTQDEIEELCEEVAMHDSSKFSKRQFIPYRDFTWAKKNNEELSEELQKEFDKAGEDHYLNEEHHPEMKKPGLDFYAMQAIHCACDLQAMSQEFGEASCRQYFENTWKEKSRPCFKEKTHFDEMCKVIEKCIDCFESLSSSSK